MKKTGPLHYLGLLFVVAVFLLAAWLLYRQWHDNHLTLQGVWNDLLDIHKGWLLAAIGLTIVNYAILVGYDYLAFRYAKVPISVARMTFAALATYAFSYNFGATLAGVPLRYRLYTSWNIPLPKIVQLLVILAFTFWFGVFALAGTLFVVTPLQVPANELQNLTKDMVNLGLPEKAASWFTFLFADSRKFGFILLLLAMAYVGTSLLHRGSLKIFRWTLPVPPPRLTIYQIAIASADMLVAGGVLYMLCPPVRGGYWTVLEVYMVAFVLNVISHVPGGWGIIEGTIVGLLGGLDKVPDPAANMSKVFAAIVVFRVIYFLLPLFFSTVMVLWHEYALRQNWVPPLIPHAEDASPNGQPHSPSTKPRVEKT
jgi:uncharacterized membrane protein YbhN (UPF0104 family)